MGGYGQRGPSRREARGSTMDQRGWEGTSRTGGNLETSGTGMAAPGPVPGIEVLETGAGPCQDGDMYIDR